MHTTLHCSPGLCWSIHDLQLRHLFLSEKDSSLKFPPSPLFTPSDQMPYGSLHTESHIHRKMLHNNLLIMVPRTHSVQGTICICPEQLGMAHFLSKNLENVQQNCEHRELRISADLDSALKVGKLTSPPPPHPDIGNLGF